MIGVAGQVFFYLYQLVGFVDVHAGFGKSELNRRDCGVYFPYHNLE